MGSVSKSIPFPASAGPPAPAPAAPASAPSPGGHVASTGGCQVAPHDC
jgi:hypothetical protein